MKDRYLGKNGRAARIAALRKQRTLEGASSALLAALDKASTIQLLKKGETIITQDMPNSDVFFVLAGVGLQVFIHKRLWALREPGELLGEMSMLVRNSKPSATVCAAGPTVVARIAQEKFLAIANKHPELLWRGIATVLAERLQQRNAHMRPRSAIPRVFVGSSSERLEAAQAARKALTTILGKKKVEVVVWNDPNAIFNPGSTAMADLVLRSQDFDFGLFVFAPDDKLELRDVSYEAVRDNVVLELGLYMGALNDTKRALVLQPVDKAKKKNKKKAKEKKLRKPTDLDGMTVLMYDPKDEKNSIHQAMELFAKVIQRDGPR